MNIVSITTTDDNLASEIKSPWRQYINGKDLVAAAPDIIGIGKSDLFGPSRCAEYCQPRVVVMLALHRLGMRYSQIATLTGRLNHTTAMNGVKRAKILVARYPDYAKLLRALEDAV